MQKMNSDSGNPQSSSGRFLHTVRPLRDLESNWNVDLSNKLEEYLLKICSGQILGDEDSTLSVNFSEAALLLQGSVQVYSKKVEYLYSLVLHAINFISNQSQEDEEVSPSSKPVSTGGQGSKEEGHDTFWGLDDIPVDKNNLLDFTTCIVVPSSHFVRPPAYLLVLEGECLDAGFGTVELESYMLGGCVLYRDFILLDASDAIAVDNFLDSRAYKGASNVYSRTNSLSSKSRKSYQSPSRASAEKLSAKKKNDVDVRFEPNDCSIGHSPLPAYDDKDDGFGIGDAYAESGDFDESDDDDDPWKPLNPHAPGNFNVKPYNKVTAKARLNVSLRKHQTLTVEFPLAKLGILISPDLNDIWQVILSEKLGKSESIPLYEKLRQSLVLGGKQTNNGFFDAEDNGYESGDVDIEAAYFDKTLNPEDEKEIPEAHANLEDLCHSHVDSLPAENEKQTELATRVCRWRQRMEQNLEEQDARPPFNIYEYRERVVHKLSLEEDALSFGDIVKGQKKHDVARTFSALLQLVNSGDVDLVRSISPATDENRFLVRLLRNDKKRNSKGKENLDSYPYSRFTPQGKKRRKSRIFASL